MKKTFYITYKIEARFIAAVDAESLEEAMEAAEGRYHDATFGEAEDIRLKERVCLELMEQYPDQIAYINVRVAERPTWRSI